MIPILFILTPRFPMYSSAEATLITVICKSWHQTDHPRCVLDHSKWKCAKRRQHLAVLNRSGEILQIAHLYHLQIAGFVNMD